MTIKFHPTYREALCDNCNTMFFFQEGADYYDDEDFFMLLDFLGWRQTWIKSERRYKHTCHECKTRANESFKNLKQNAPDNLWSVEKAK